MKKHLFSLWILWPLLAWSLWFAACEKKAGIPDEQDSFQRDTAGIFTDSRDGKKYRWIKIDNHIWMAENLAYTGRDIRHVTDIHQWVNNTEYHGWSYYDNNPRNANTYGVHYQWEAARRACPPGWHLPTREEWQSLIRTLGGPPHAGGKLKETGTAHWNYPNTNATNSSGFTALPAGEYSGYSSGMGKVGYWWTGSGHQDRAHVIILYHNHAECFTMNLCKTLGASVRCVKD